MTKTELQSERLRRAVHESGLTRYAVFRQTGISESTLSRFIVGGTGLSLDNVDLLVEALELKLVAKGERKNGKKGNA